MVDETIAKISIRNYRCFGDEGAKFLLRPGFTAFVGPNNSGKTILLRFWRELRPLLVDLGDAKTFDSWVKAPRAGQLLDTEDVEEIFRRGSSAPVIVDIEVQRSIGMAEVSRIQLEFQRDPNVWSLKFAVGSNTGKLAGGPKGLSEILLHNGRTKGEQPASLTGMAEIARIAANSVFIGAFRHAHSIGGMEYGDVMVGNTLISQWHEWQTGASIANKEKLRRVEIDVGRIFSIPNLQVLAATGTGTLQVRIDGRDYDLREVGSGLAQCLMVLANVAFKAPSFILIDEPELGMHPSLQVDFLATLQSYAKDGVMFATHSLGLARTVSDNHYIVFKEDGRARCRPWQRAPELTEFLGEMSYGGYRELGNELVLCVEGPNDVMPVRQFLRLLGKEHSTVVIHLGGDAVAHANAPEMISEVQKLAAKVAVLLDSEKPAQDQPPKANRNLLAEECPKLGVPFHLTDRRAFENYFTDRAVKASMGPAFRALLEFEELKTATLKWNKKDNWRIAGEMTRDELLATDVGQFLKDL